MDAPRSFISVLPRYLLSTTCLLQHIPPHPDARTGSREMKAGHISPNRGAPRPKPGGGMSLGRSQAVVLSPCSITRGRCSRANRKSVPKGRMGHTIGGRLHRPRRARPLTAFSELWSRAPLWRGAPLLGLATTALAVVYPPTGEQAPCQRRITARHQSSRPRRSHQLSARSWQR